MKKSTLITVVVFAVLLALVLLINDRPVERGREELSFADLDVEAVDSLHIETKDAESVASIELDRQDGVWRLPDGHLADTDAINRALEAIKAVDTSDVVSTSTDRHTNYGVDADKGLTVEAGAGRSKAVRLVIGDSGNGGVYLRRVGDDTIFQSSGGLRHLFPTDVKRWLKLKLIDTPLEDAERVELRLASGSAYDIVPAADGKDWTITDPSLLPDGFRFDGPGARALANNLVTVRAREIVDETEGIDPGFEVPHDVFTVVSNVGSTTLHIGNEADDNTVYAKVDGRDALFKIPAYQAKNLHKEINDLRDLRLMDIATDQVTAVSLRHGRTDYRFTRNDQGLWQIDPAGAKPEDGFAFDPGSLDRLVQSLDNLRATSVAGDMSRTKSGLDSPDPLLVLSFDDGSSAELRFGASSKDADDRTSYYASGNADDLTYTVPEYLRGRFTRGWETFEVVEPPPNMGGNNPLANLDPETLKNLPPEVRESLMKQMQEQAQKQRLMEQIRQRENQ